MIRVSFCIIFLSLVNLSYSQIRSIGSVDTLRNNNNYYENQYTSLLFACNSDFFNGDSIKGKNQYAATHTYLVKDFNGDGFSDLFLSFFTGGELEKVPVSVPKIRTV